MNTGTIRGWIELLPAQGRYAFTRGELEARGTESSHAIKLTLGRLKASGKIVGLRRGFFVVVPTEYHHSGAPPVSWFIDDLMEHLGRPYYVALLTAAALHGSAHQQPMTFQVMTDRPERTIPVGRTRIDFHASNFARAAAVELRQTETGLMKIGTPETTAIDLVRFPSAGGHWNNVAIAIKGFMDEIEPEALVCAVQNAPRSDVQRLGWLLDYLGAQELGARLRENLSGARLHSTALSLKHPTAAALPDPVWKVIPNIAWDLDV